MTAAPAPSAFTHDEPDVIVTGEGVEVDIRATGVILRAAGTIIDALVTVILIVAGMYLLATSSVFFLSPALSRPLMIMLVVAAAILLPALVETLSRGRSLGRLAIGARIVRTDGGPVQFRHALIRSLTGLLEIYMTAGGLAAIVGLFSARSQRLGDHLAGTYSRQERIRRPGSRARPVPPELATWAAGADVARLPDRLAWRVARFLDNLEHLSPASRHTLGRELADEVRPLLWPVPPEGDPVLLLIAVSAVRRERDARALAAEARRLARLDAVLSPAHRS